MQSDFKMKKEIFSTYNFLRLHSKSLLILLVVMLSISNNVQSQTTTLVTIANQSGAPSAMKLSELKSVFMGEQQRWKDGKRILIALMKTGTPIGKVTSERIYDMTGDELNKYWLSLVFQGKAQAPVFFNTAIELENYVAQNQGAIGILGKPAIDIEVKTILIDGQKSY